ncbi:MAG: restriction endonuclease subunit S [Bacteroidetes bacterium]|nr:restriction endonuclease subunit S [Bacteroidota bacterium]
MSSVEALVSELCPGGVQFVELQEVFDINNGYSPSKYNQDFWTDGIIPWFRLEDIRKNGRVLSDSIQHVTPQAVKKGTLFPANSIIIATNATIGEHALITVDSLANQRFTVLSKKANRSAELDMKFMFYYGFILGQWCKKNTNPESFPSVNMKKFKKLRIPIPPLKVQNAIVEILDTYTALQKELQILLIAELEARKKQYEYCREEMLRLDEEEVERKTLGEILQYELPTKYLIEHAGYDESNKTPVLTAGKNFILGYTNEKTGVYPASSENPVIIFDDFTTSFKWVNFPFKAKSSTMKMITPQIPDSVNFRYIYYAMSVINYTPDSHTRQWTKNYSKLLIPIPSLEKQNEIVTTLDQLDTLVNDLSTRIPAEIIARRKQYEYCRNLLLSFPRSKENGVIR